MSLRTTFLLTLLWAIFADLAVAQPAGFNYDEANVPEYSLPPLLVREDGSTVTTAEEWTTARRQEILSLFREHVFGHLPPQIPRLRVRLRSRKDNAVEGLAIRREITVFFTDDDAGPAMDLLVYTPVAASGPVATFLGYNAQGNHTIDGDPDIHLPETWVRGYRSKNGHKALDADRGRTAYRWDVKTILEAGMGLVTIHCGDVDPDFDDGFRNGIHAMFEDKSSERPGNAGGTISAWAWGLSRALDVLETDPLVDGSRVAVIGHSRLGKTALWAGANDQRFALIISNNSGCGGAALSRRRFGETVARINTTFPHWFCRNHRQYNDNEDALPVDHHMLIALAAPRPVYVASAKGDVWADPRGEMLSLFHAGDVYRLFGKEGLPNDQLPQLDMPIHADVAYHIRSGKHEMTPFDWKHYVAFAKRHLQ